MTSIIDTNVILVANGQHHGVDLECLKACVLRLQAIMQGQRIALDQDFEILSEYQRKTSRSDTRKRPGDAFVKWALQNKANPDRCDQIALKSHPERGYDSFPDDERLADFDPEDRKFVAVASSHESHPPILQAADSKWIDWQIALEDHGIRVEFLCPDVIRRFHQKKSGT